MKTIGRALLFVAIAGLAHAAPDPPKTPPPTRELAKGLEVLLLIGADERYVYFAKNDASNFSGVQTMRVPKAGGPAQPVPELVNGVIPSLATSHQGRRFMMTLSESVDTASAFMAAAEDELNFDIVALDEASHKITRLVPQRPHSSNLQVTPGGLFWVEGEQVSDKDRPQKLVVFAADHDGRNVRQLWKGSDSRLVRLIAKGSDLYLFLSAPRHLTMPKKPGGAARFVKKGRFSTVWLIPQAGDAPRLVWKDEDLLLMAALDGDDLYACSGTGLYKVSSTGPGASARIAAHCGSHLLIWKGWRFEVEDSFYVQPIQFGRVESKADMKELFHATLGRGVVTDDRAVYACVVSSEDRSRCDLMRVDAAELEARAKQPAR